MPVVSPDPPIETPPASTPAPPPAPPLPTARVTPKHHPLVRLTHWANVPLLVLLIATGLAIYWAAPVFTHARDPVTGSKDYVADAAIAIERVVGRGGGAPGEWIYDRLSLGADLLEEKP